MDESVVKHLNPESYDVVMLYDYHSIGTEKLPLTDEFAEYSHVYIVAWSMGVMIATIIAEKIFEADKIMGKTAVNGTLFPINETFGISPRIYDLTVRRFDEAGRDKFISGMFDNGVPEKLVIRRSLQTQKLELEALKTYASEENFKYTKIFISDNDKIIPSGKQCAYWGIEPNLKGGHCPFFGFEKWGELL